MVGYPILDPDPVTVAFDMCPDNEKSQARPAAGGLAPPELGKEPPLHFARHAGVDIPERRSWVVSDLLRSPPDSGGVPENLAAPPEAVPQLLNISFQPSFSGFDREIGVQLATVFAFRTS